MAAGQRVVAFDPHDEYSQKGRDSGQVRLGPCRERMTVEELTEHLEVLDADDLSLAVVPSGNQKEIAEAFEALAAELLEVGECVLLADELGQWGGHAKESIDNAACQSRHSNVPLVYVAQRLTQIPKTARTQATHVNSGRQDNPDDLKALADLCGEEFAAEVSRLSRGAFKAWRDDLTPTRSTLKRKAAP